MTPLGVQAGDHFVETADPNRRRLGGGLTTDPPPSLCFWPWACGREFQC
jgi:hypothetical protein